MDAADLIATGNPLAQLGVRLGPIRLALAMSIAAIVLLLVPAWIAGVHSLTTSAEDVGLWWQPNWSLMFPLVLPLIFACFIPSTSSRTWSRAPRSSPASSAL